MTGAPITILLIEDNPGDARLIREILTEETSARFTLEHAAQLATGLARLAEGGIDVVLLDLSLPDSQGFDTFERVQARSHPMPIIVLTGLDDETVAVETLEAGAQDYLVKTFLNYAILHRSVQHAIVRKRAEVELRRAREAAEAANRAKDRFLDDLGHELWAPLEPVLSTVDALMDDPAVPAALLPRLDLIRRHVEQVARRIEEILDASLIPGGRTRPDRAGREAGA